MLLLIVAAASLAASVFAGAELVTMPERERRALVRRAAHYGRVRPALQREERLSLRERVIVPASARVASLMLRVNRHESLEKVQLRLLAAGMSGVSPNAFLAFKGGLAAGGALFGVLLWAGMSGKPT